MSNTTTSYSFGQKLGAWSVHLFTSSGIVAGFLAIVAIEKSDFLFAFFWLLVALIIDGIDGTFARIFKVGEVLPQMDGKTIDYVVDFCNYAVIPAYLIYAAHINGVYLLPEELRTTAAIIVLLVSAIYYGKDGMVSSDLYFVGFPVMWNFVAFYIFYVFNVPPIGNFFIIVFFAVMHFVPMKYLYPSRTKKFQAANILNSILCIGSNFALVLLIESGSEQAGLLLVSRIVSIVTLLYFGFLAVYNTWFDPDTKI